MLFDLHMHSVYSADSVSKPETIVKVCKENNIGFSLTDHQNMYAYSGKNGIKNLAKKAGVFLVPGEELIVVEDGHVKGEVIGYFLQKEIPPKTFSEIVDEIKEQGALLSCPHPFDWPRKNFGDFKKEWKKFDAMEVYNARAYHSFLNRNAQKFASGKKIARLGVSDAHTPEEIGNGLTEINATNELEFRKEIKKQRTKVIINKKAKLWHHFQTALARKKLVKPR